MRITSFLLLVSSILVAGAPAATSTDGDPSVPDPTGDLPEPEATGDPYAVTKTPNTTSTWEIGTIVKIQYRKTFTGKPILDIHDQTEKGETELRDSLASRIKAVSADEAKVKIEKSPYAIFHNYELRMLIMSYISKEQRGKFKPHKITPKKQMRWKEYKETYGFKVVSEIFAPRVIKSIKVKHGKSTSQPYEAWFTLGNAKS